MAKFVDTSCPPASTKRTNILDNYYFLKSKLEKEKQNWTQTSFEAEIPEMYTLITILGYGQEAGIFARCLKVSSICCLSILYFSL